MAITTATTQMHQAAQHPAQVRASRYRLVSHPFITFYRTYFHATWLIKITPLNTTPKTLVMIENLPQNSAELFYDHQND